MNLHRYLPAVAALLVAAAPGLRAQALSGTLIDEAGAPISGAAVYVLDASGARAGAVLSDGAGRFRVQLPAVGTYGVRVERIGFETEQVDAIDVPDESTWTVRIPLAERPLTIDPLAVTAERVCLSERNRNPELLRIWAEVRKGLARTAVARADASFAYRVEVSERVLDPALRLLRGSADTLALEGAHAFTFQGIGDLGSTGWGEVHEDGVTDLYGPSPDVFLSARFGATHCLSLGERDGPGGLLGLDFASIADSLEVGMEGTFWLDPAGWRLHRIDFRYTGTERLAEAEGQGGSVVLGVDEGGTGYAAAWSIRGPLYEGDGTRRLTGYLEHAGRALAPEEVAATVTSPWATPEALRALDPTAERQRARQLGEAIRAACAISEDTPLPAVLAGTVTDSVSGVLLPGAQVRMEWDEPGDSLPHALQTRTDQRGYFQFCNAPAGRQVALIAVLRAPSAPVTVDVEPKMLHVERLKLALSDPSQPGLLVGRVIDAQTRHPVTNAEIRLDEREGVGTLTNGEGYFSLGRQPWGAYHLTVTALGYLRRTASVRIEGGLTQTVDVEVSSEPIPIEGLAVSVRGRMIDHDMDDLVQRMKAGWGTYLTRDLLERRPSANVADLLREAPGIQVRYTGLDPYLEVRGRTCTPDVYVDGTYWAYGFNYVMTGYWAKDLEAIEIYRGVASTPGIFMRMGLPPCAVIVVWTK